MTVADGPERPGDAETRFVWDYARTDERLRALYERGKAAQWNATTDIDWAAGVGTPATPGSAAAISRSDGTRAPSRPGAGPRSTGSSIRG